jgi:hypothetical protein
MKNNEIKWTRSEGVYKSKDGKYKIRNGGKKNWYLYINDGTKDWDTNYAEWSNTLEGVKFWAEWDAEYDAKQNNLKAGA